LKCFLALLESSTGLMISSFHTEPIEQRPVSLAAPHFGRHRQQEMARLSRDDLFANGSII
jgi:hypothetical protein